MIESKFIKRKNDTVVILWNIVKREFSLHCEAKMTHLLSVVFLNLSTICKSPDWLLPNRHFISLIIIVSIF